MNAAQLLATLSQLGVKLWVEGDRICYDAPVGAFTPELRDEVTRHRKAILDHLPL